MTGKEVGRVGRKSEMEEALIDEIAKEVKRQLKEIVIELKAIQTDC